MARHIQLIEKKENEMKALALTADIYKIIAEYNAQYDAIPALVESAQSEIKKAESAAFLRGGYAGELYRGHAPDLVIDRFRKHLLRSSWRYLYTVLKIETIAPESSKKKLLSFINDPLEFSEDIIGQVFKGYVDSDDRKMLFLQSFAEVFGKLDKKYKSHDPFKVGVKGLPKKIIIGGCDTDPWRSGWERVTDTLNAINKVSGTNAPKYNTTQVFDMVKSDSPYNYGLSFKHYKNGNVHIIFDDNTLKIINSVLASFYGEVLPDAADKPGNSKQSSSTAVSKDLQFYRTPLDAAERLIWCADIREGHRVLEPSCGDGALLDVIIRECGKGIAVTAVEYCNERVRQCRAKGHTVNQSNFLEFQTIHRFDRVVMNPPFYGRHYEKHVRHAYSLLKQGGELYAILPASAYYSHCGLEDLNPVWQDLPVGSFRESGTGINTVICEIRKR